MRTVRSYNKLVNELINLQIPFRVEIAGYVQYDNEIYPMMEIKHISKVAKKQVVLVSGIHGNEHYAVHTLLKWIQQFNPTLLSECNFSIYPVCNPYGYAKNSRKNGARQMVNNYKKFSKGSDVQELAILFEHMPSNPDLYLDIHGDVSKKFVYAYERVPMDKKSIVSGALIEHDTLLPYEKTQTIYKSKVQDGVINTPDADVGIEGCLEMVGTNHTVALELPGKCNGQARSSGGVAIINSILKNFVDDCKKEGTNETKS
jgi:predicted deacylase